MTVKKLIEILETYESNKEISIITPDADSCRVYDIGMEDDYVVIWSAWNKEEE